MINTLFTFNFAGSILPVAETSEDEALVDLSVGDFTGFFYRHTYEIKREILTLESKTKNKQLDCIKNACIQQLKLRFTVTVNTNKKYKTSLTCKEEKHTKTYIK